MLRKVISSIIPVAAGNGTGPMRYKLEDLMRAAALTIACISLSAAASADPELTGQAVLEQNCSGCHTQASPMGGLDLRTRESALRGGRRGPALVPGQAAKSLIFQAVAGSGELKMPPGKKLPAEAVAALREWIDAGAPWQQDAWAFQPLLKSAGLASVDEFISQKLRDAGLQPAPAADRATLIRRATIDLIGLPPTPAEVDAFVKDGSPDAFRSVVERLL